MRLQDIVNELVDILGCSRYRAKRIVLAAYRDGYRWWLTDRVAGR